jgi:hypothetical protein
MTSSISFRSAEHRTRLAESIERLGKVERSNGKIDPWYGAALYILSADLHTWNSSQPFISSHGIKFDEILANNHFSSGYITLIEVAANLFLDNGHVDLSRFTNLDENNFKLAIDAIKLRRYSLLVSDLK